MASYGEVPSRDIKELSIRNKSESIRHALSSCADHEETFDLLCAQCFDDKRHVEAAGCCVDCEDLLCKGCIQKHGKIRGLKHHVIQEFTCAQCLEAKQLVTASGFCTVCNDYLCDKCIAEHRRIRALKKHNILMGENMPFLPADKNVSTTKTKSRPQHQEADSLHHARKQKNFIAKSTTENKICSIRASAVLSTGEVLLCDTQNKNIKLFNGELKECFKLTTESYPRDICLSKKSTKEVYVTVPQTKSILCVRADGGNIKKTKMLIVDAECYGITCWKSGIVITAWYFDDERWELQLLDYEGNVVRKFQQDATNRLEFRWPEYLTSVMNGKQIIISDPNASSVTSVDVTSGRVVFVYKNENLEWPVSVTADSQDNIYVAAHWSHNVHVISAAGENIAVILSQKDGLHYPTGICYNRSNDTLFMQPSKDKSEMTMFKIYEQ